MNERMSAGETSVPLDELLAHREWVRRLALAITRDEHEADDVEQATWVAALRRPPTHRASLRGWLGTTVRRAASRLRRSERRRAHHEGAVPVRSHAEDAADLATRADAHRRVVEALVALEEPLRRTLLLRYFEGLPVGDVAARTGVPLETCRARLRRGRAKLRERLEREFGGSDAFGAAVVLLAGRDHGGGVAPAAGGMAMAGAGTKVVAGFGLAVAAGAAAWWTLAGGSPAEEVAGIVIPPTPAATAPVPRAVRRADPPAPAAAEPSAESALPATPPPPPPPATEPRVLDRLQSVRLSVSWTDVPVVEAIREVCERAQVEVVAVRSQIDARVADCSVHLRLEDVTAVTALRTTCKVAGLECDLDGPRVVIHAGIPPTGAMSLDPLPRRIPRGPDGRLTRVAVRVVDREGTPVEGASLFVAGSTVPAATSGPGGEAEVPVALSPLRVLARRPGSVDSFVLAVVPGEGSSAAEIRLRGPAARLRGTVRDRSGVPVARASVSWTASSERARFDVEAHEIRTDRDGNFDDPGAAPGPGALRVSANGFAPVTLDLDVPAGSESPRDILLPPESACVGTARAADGTPRRVAVVASRADDGARLGSVVAKPDGTYRIGSLPSGRVVLRVSDARRSPAGPLAETTLDLAEGATVTWDPVVELPVK